MSTGSIIWLGFILATILISMVKKPKNNQNVTINKHVPLASIPNVTTTNSNVSKIATPIKTNLETKAQSAPISPIIDSLPIEGERVTASKPSAAVTNESLIESGLHDKDKLKRALILGEILAPKF